MSTYAVGAERRTGEAAQVRLGTYSGCPPPAAIVAGKALMKDPRTTPQYAERVPYVVVCGQPGAILRELVMSPHEVVQDPRRRLHFGYYLNKQVRALYMYTNARAPYCTVHSGSRRSL